MSVELLYITPDPDVHIANMMGVCYNNTCSSKSFHAALNKGHMSLLELAYAQFKITCSLSCSHQIVRHRHFSYLQKSLRKPTGAAYMFPDQAPEVVWEVYDEYEDQLASGVPAEEARLILPVGTQTTLIMSGNLRCWWEYLIKRTCRRAQEEHRIIADSIEAILTERIPGIMVCYADACQTRCNICKDSCKF